MSAQLLANGQTCAISNSLPYSPLLLLSDFKVNSRKQIILLLLLFFFLEILLYV